MIADGEGRTLYSRDLDPQIAKEGIELARELGVSSGTALCRAYRSLSPGSPGQGKQVELTAA